MKQAHLCISQHPQNVMHSECLSHCLSQENKLLRLTEFLEGKCLYHMKT